MTLSSVRVPLRGIVFPCTLLVGVIAGCRGEPTGPDGQSPSTPGIHVVAGADVTDTIDATLPLALRLQVVDPDGHAMPGVIVRLNSLPVTHGPLQSGPSVLVGSLSAPGTSSFLAETTSAKGEALARVVMGGVAGAGGVVITVPETGYQDTARFTITAGAAARVVLPVTDTAVVVGRALALAGRTEDRRGNARTDVVAYEATGSGVTVTGSQVTGSAPVRSRVIGRFGALVADTTWVSVVPSAKVATWRSSKLVTIGLDGTGLTTIPHSLEVQDPSPDWSPDGQSLLAILGTFGGPRALYRVGLDASIQPMTNSTALPGYVYSGTYSPDGQWLYVSSGTCNYAAILYRVQVANPLTVERLSPTGLDECFELVNHWPSVSPDGTRLTFENQTWNQQGYSVRVMDIATKAITEIATGGQRPSWSPAGDLIAFWQDNAIRVIKPDGTGLRVLSPSGHSYVQGVQWSPDGQWILARFAPVSQWAGTTIALLSVSTGMEIPLPWSTGYGTFGLPAWKPR